MKISYNWLKQFIKTDWPAEKAEELLTDLGLEVEGLETFESVKGSLKGIVVGHVLSCEQHPNADRLKITKVDLGKETVQIVCGAPNVDEGQKVPVATIGTVLYDDKGDSFKIKKGKIRGEESFGMICAEDEIGLGKSHDGILVLDNTLIPGTPLNEIFDVENDQVFEIGLTPNRADAMSHWGVARDFKAGLIQHEENASLVTPSVSSFHVENRSNRIAIEVENSELAPRYCGLTISEVKIQDSPKWIQNRLKAIGVTPKNNIVDITNYVMHELGQPLHAFDADKIIGKKIQVKTLPKGTKFTTLDEIERELHEDDLMICNAEKPMCIAGVLGGLESGVSETTSSIFLESAYFNPISVRKSAKRHGLNTDASFRFERGVDPNSTKYALKRAALLIQETAGGYISSDLDDFYPKKIEDFQVFLSYEKINNLIGQNLETIWVKEILAALEIHINNITETGMGLTIPAYRVDVQREIDVIEEILRVYGYNNVAFSKKLNASIAPTSRFEDYKLQNIIAEQLVNQGFYEIMANSLSSENYLKLDETSKEEQVFKILNPLSKDLSVMRQNMLFSGLEALAYNFNRQNENLKFFEFGKTYHKYDKERVENKHLSLLVSGKNKSENWAAPSEKTSFFYLKGTLTTLLTRLGISETKMKSSKNPFLSEGMCISANKTNLVDFGVVKKHYLKAFGIDQEVLYADINWDCIMEEAKNNSIKFQSIPKFPSVRRDFALLLDQEVQFEEIEEIAQKQGKKILQEVNLFDVYQGKNLPEGKKSYAVSFIFRDDNKTLTDKQVDKIMKKLQTGFETKLNASLR